jgi:uncharacterized integral membrane protein
MLLDTPLIAAIVIALSGSILVMGLFLKQNFELQKEIVRLQVALRTERRKTK